VDRLPRQHDNAEERVQQLEQERQALLQERDSREHQNEELRESLEKLHEELRRLSREMEAAPPADGSALEEKLAEAERDRGQMQEREAAQSAVQQQLETDLREALAQNTNLQSELEKLRAALTNNEAELQRVNAERQRLLNEYGQQCMELIGLQKELADAAGLKAEIARLEEELERARGATPAGVPGRGGRKSSEQGGEQARRDEEVRRLKEHIARLEKDLASRGAPLPLAALPPALQQILTHMGSEVDAQRIVTDLWERLMEQESRFNAARDDTNRRMGELEELRRQLAQVYGNIITPITVLSATADLLAMRQDMPKGAQKSLEELKQIMATVRQAISRMQKITTTGHDKE
jgi:DNA repair exonuclease SbcCD ATPase subunit